VVQASCRMSFSRIVMDDPNEMPLSFHSHHSQSKSAPAKIRDFVAETQEKFNWCLVAPNSRKPPKKSATSRNPGGGRLRNARESVPRTRFRSRSDGVAMADGAGWARSRVAAWMVRVAARDRVRRRLSGNVRPREFGGEIHGGCREGAWRGRKQNCCGDVG
jgi:hypothetical protein